MGSVCAEHQHEHKPFFSPTATTHHRALLRRPLINPLEIPDSYSPNSPKTNLSSSPDTLFLHKYLPSAADGGGASDDGSDSDDPYSDYFRMFEFKIRRCTRSRSHDWTDCPFAHPGEKARRRDPRRYHYSGAVCPEFRRGGGTCSRGDDCEFAHGVFEVWLHPARYRTEACKDGRNCRRKVCFFAHTPRQLRVLPPSMDASSSPASPFAKKHRNRDLNAIGRCCQFCHSITSSPTSTLAGIPNFSPATSPPMSPEKSRSMGGGFSPISRSGNRLVSYGDVLADLLSSLEGVNLNDSPFSSPATMNAKTKKMMPWGYDGCFDGEDQQELGLSPDWAQCASGSSRNPSVTSCSTKCLNEEELNGNNTNDSGLGCPDLGWVNDLLM